jgi:hypothetical protein
MAKPLILLFVFSLTGFLGSNGWAYTQNDCIQCHREGSKKSAPQISVETFETSIHGGALTCQDCHNQVKDETHQMIKGSGFVDCNQCHEQANRHGLHSNGEMRPRCYSCHMKHNILAKDNPESSVHRGRLKKTCEGCHPIEAGKTTYLSWLPSLKISSHEKQDFGQAYTKENCIGCHQGKAVHGEEDPISGETCDKCHLSHHGQGILWGRIHVDADLEKQPATFASAAIYQFVLVILLWAGFRYFVKRFTRKSS